MIELTTQKIEGYAQNLEAAKNGRALVAKNKFANLKIDKDQTLIWGDCAGSGKNPYYCSADFIEENNPVFRCNCPSRQFPCKHALGLMFAYQQQASGFTIDEIPQDITNKRDKIEKKQEKKEQEKKSLKEKAEQPKKVNKAAVIKKIDTQLLGIQTAGKILNNIVQNGLSSINAKEKRNLQTQIKELGNYYIPGIQTAYNDLLLDLEDVENEQYSHVIDQLNYIAALLKKATEYLNQRKEDPEAEPEINSAIEEQIGYIWKLTDLIKVGLWEENAELVQLSFNSYDNPARREFIDEGSWLNLKTGKLYKTKTFRPYRATKYIKEDNSVPNILQLKDLYIYPGGINPRVRWEANDKSERIITEDDLTRIQSYANTNYAELLKSVKTIIKNPLMDKNPLILIAIHKAYLNGEHIVVEDAQGNKLTLKDMPGRAASSENSLKMILPKNPMGISLLAMINNDIETGLLSAQPLSLINSSKIIKLLY